LLAARCQVLASVQNAISSGVGCRGGLHLLQVDRHRLGRMSAKPHLRDMRILTIDKGSNIHPKGSLVKKSVSFYIQ
jgi:hypothetical protein